MLPSSDIWPSAFKSSLYSFEPFSPNKAAYSSFVSNNSCSKPTVLPSSFAVSSPVTNNCCLAASFIVSICSVNLLSWLFKLLIARLNSLAPISFLFNWFFKDSTLEAMLSFSFIALIKSCFWSSLSISAIFLLFVI